MNGVEKLADAVKSTLGASGKCVIYEDALGKPVITKDGVTVAQAINLVDEIDVASKDVDGTAIGMAIANATNRLRESLSESKIMILLSDGSNNSGEIDPPTAAKLANEFGIKIYTIAAGTDNSISRIPGMGMIRNEIDINTLKDISKETGGKFFRATDKEALSKIYARIDELERSEIEVRNFTDYKELFRWFLVPALFLALIYFILKRYIFKVNI